MGLEGRTRLIGRTLLFMLVAANGAGAAEKPGMPLITIGGVIYTDVKDPMRTGLPGVTVKVRGAQGEYTAVTGGLIGLWKMDVPLGTYTVTPKKSNYLLQHLVAGWCDDQRWITIEVKRETLAANQSIQFLAIPWPDSEMPPAKPEPTTEPRLTTEPAATASSAITTSAGAPTRGDRAPGGGCAAARGHRAKARDFFAPYVACVSVLLTTNRLDARKHRPQRKSHQGSIG